METSEERPFRERYLIAEKYDEYDVRTLKQFLTEQDSNPLFVRIVNALRKSGVVTLGRLLDFNDIDLIKIRWLGPNSYKLLHELLSRAAGSDQLQMFDPMIRKPKIKPDPIAKLKERYLKRTMNLKDTHN
jgi:DNA-directed RNA polymerase alpha subunit